MRAAPSLLAAVALGCSKAPTVIDGSSPEAFAESTEKARRDLPVAERLAFDSALKSPPGKRISDNDFEAAAIARNTYDGMTAVEVVEINR
ncbi:hypothetical protein G7076_08240 [Sphingomonas sp. HDW15A]|uniref:DUF6694 family lipoprotein n=1 Tax=Sphingomonas sp. HDW15A TaxID=2714942 RepID=UPI0014088734|nr:DUF6694 family lipoprotein [Sphingomonas sp. HDW15A]QIK96432.1 hypothetical protein G7076_08240 [Sphingomonas sp. HDW15A]